MHVKPGLWSRRWTEFFLMTRQAMRTISKRSLQMLTIVLTHAISAPRTVQTECALIRNRAWLPFYISAHLLSAYFLAVYAYKCMRLITITIIMYVTLLHS